MINYFYRNSNAGYSIKKVFNSITLHFSNKKEFYVPYNGGKFHDIIFNTIYVFMHRWKKGINHVTGDIHYCCLALPSYNTILTIHDLVLLNYNKASKFKR